MNVENVETINPVDEIAQRAVERAIRVAVRASVAADARIIADRADIAVRLALASFGIVSPVR